MKLAIISDLHGNSNALESVLDDISKHDIDSIVCLGDIINYGSDSDKCINLVKKECDYIIEGNHEDSINREDYSKFSTDRGKEVAKNLTWSLSRESLRFLSLLPSESVILASDMFGNKVKVLLVHASLGDNWNDPFKAGKPSENYAEYDYVIYGHTHIPHLQNVFYKSDDESMRNKKKVTFVNPGSVGQPRDHDWRASYCILDTETGDVQFERVSYDVRAAQDAILNNPSIPDFYAERLEKGI